MAKYNYKETVKDDCVDAIHEWIDYHKEDVVELSDDRLFDKLYDALWTDDSVTGNGSGSYTFSAYDAEQNLVGNRDLLREALEEFGYEKSEIGNLIEDKGPEWCDVTIRCYLLSNCLHDALDEMEDELEEIRNSGDIDSDDDLDIG